MTVTVKAKRLIDLSIHEISLVDKPAQEPALIACVKRAPSQETAVKQKNDAPPPVAVEPVKDETMDPVAMAARIKELEDELAALKAKGEEPAVPAIEAAAPAAVAKAAVRIYKSASGEEFFAGDERTAEYAKRADEATAKARTIELTKRAEAEMATLPGTIVEKVAVLEWAASAPAPVAASLTKMLGARAALLAPLFKQLGTSEGDVEADPLSTIDKMAADIAKRDGVSIEIAKAAAWDTAEGRQLAAQLTNKRKSA